MSYDLMVFEISKAPKTKEEFMAWYEEQTQWSEDHSYNDPKIASPALKDWYEKMKKTFMPMNESSSAEENLDEDEESNLTDYSIGSSVIYAAFSWSKAEEAYTLTTELAQKCGVGFFDVSGDGDIVMPDGSEIN